MSQKAETIIHRITPAPTGQHCWCGKDAIVTRVTPGVESSYCATHWELWWELEMSGNNVSAEIAM